MIYSHVQSFFPLSVFEMQFEQKIPDQENEDAPNLELKLGYLGENKLEGTEDALDKIEGHLDEFESIIEVFKTQIDNHDFDSALRQWIEMDGGTIITMLNTQLNLLQQIRKVLLRATTDQIYDYGRNSFTNLRMRLQDLIQYARIDIRDWNNIQKVITTYALQRSTLPSVFASLEPPEFTHPQPPAPFNSIESIVGHENDFLLA